MDVSPFTSPNLSSSVAPFDPEAELCREPKPLRGDPSLLKYGSSGGVAELLRKNENWRRLECGGGAGAKLLLDPERSEALSTKWIC